ncbi:murein transglycosylase A [Azohydromonas caseinilytica]|uniref:peptidoglycan lytic exotransglycosylase n=1 Tax=Azohydromonas caseinilytica TaxID=2728836 RepID=A0A848F111_9BURK|nr:MltA domain-containing protein [Azohydromonas caseinilytica]NML13757.1 transglycosylase [Azohydromonas caseinilytica]
MSSLLAPRPSRRGGAAALALAALLAGCAGVPLHTPAPAPASSPTTTAPDAAGPGAPGAPLQRPRARWHPVDWSELPGWDGDRVLEAWSALSRSCERPGAGWAALCADVLLNAPADEAAARAWLQARLQPYRVESPEGGAEGLVTGYYEPLIEASRVPRAAFAVPLHRPPADLGARKPYWTRQQLDTLPAAAAGLRGREIAYVADPLDALVLQIQGSGRLRITEPDGRQRTVRLAFAGHNDQPYKSVGRWLIEQGALRADQASWPGIKAWARANPQRVQELLWSNPRVVFFREEPLPDPQLGPRGAQGVALTPGRSIAVDPQSIPYGTPVWLSSTEPLSAQALQRLVVAQDTGSAIVGAVRADFFWGWGEQAEQQAGRMKQPLRLWVLWPRGPQS